MNLVLVHVFPPSIVLKRPRSLFGPNRWPTAATYTMFGFVGCTTTRAIDWVSFRPMLTNVLPASVDLYIPSPNDELCLLFGSPVPT